MEAIVASLKGVSDIQLGWGRSSDQASLSEMVKFNWHPDTIPIEALVDIHLSSHSCTSSHALRDRYPSAIYTDSAGICAQVETILIQRKLNRPDILTAALLLDEFQIEVPEKQNYFYSDPNKPFCQNKILPKLHKLHREFKSYVCEEKTSFLGNSI